jgi:hypothetical protein
MESIEPSALLAERGREWAEKVVQTNIERGMTRREAEDWFGYNMLGSWVGETTPVFVILKEKK